MDIYLDVAEVLLNQGDTLAFYADGFLARMVHSRHPVSRPTTWCCDGDAWPVVGVLGRLLRSATLCLIRAIS